LDGDLNIVTNAAVAKNWDITGLTCDSRQVEPGFLFAAIPGATKDGRVFIPDALERGAVAVLAPPGTDMEQPGVPLVIDDNPRRRYALMAARFYGRQPSLIAAVTGTNGKTSVATFLRQIWAGLGRPAASAGTLGLVVEGFAPRSTPEIKSTINLTTPDPVALHKCLAQLAVNGVEHLVIEASSHGLVQSRLDGVRISAAAFTNLTRDHLDYHGDMTSYLAAKRGLFSDLLIDGGVAVINADAPYAEVFLAEARGRGLSVFTYGVGGEQVRLIAIEVLADGQRLTIEVFGQTHLINLPLVGRFQAENALCALALAIATSAGPVQASDCLNQLSCVPGRVELVARHASGAPIYVDYAHTPDALASVLNALRPHVSGRLHVVFGCGGDRDPGKRPEMGESAAHNADVVIVTDDNPRRENPAEIRAQAKTGCHEATEIGDRARAIEFAIAGLDADDLLVVAGKGHETGQEVGDEVLPFNDADTVRRVLRECGR